MARQAHLIGSVGLENAETVFSTVADKFVADYDIATECGFGRRDPATTPELLQIHAELCK